MIQALDTLSSYLPGPVLTAGILALLAIALFLARGGRPRKLFGPKMDLLNPVRRAFIPLIDQVLSEYGGYAETHVYEKEYAGTFTGSLDELEQALFDAGYRRYPIASLAETQDGRTESASWARHKPFWSKRQNHARIYDARPDVTDEGMAAFDLYVHNEYSAHHPLYMPKHYDGVGMKYEDAIQKLRRHLLDKGIRLEYHSSAGEFEPPLRNDHSED